MPTELPYGAWPSEFGVERLVSSGVRLGAPAFAPDGGLVFAERRPSDAGRTTLVHVAPGGERTDLTPPGADVRTRVHEYGGAAWWPCGRGVVFSDDRDGRLYRLEPGSAPEPMTPEPRSPRALRYADGSVSPDGETIWCVRESHAPGGEPVNEIVELSARGRGGEPRVVAGGRDFYAAPRISPDGERLAWIEWDHPRMPWDGTELVVAAPDGSDSRSVAGGQEESIVSPAWSPAGELHFCSDRSDWWNLERIGSEGERVAVAPIAAEVGGPAWVFGMQAFAFLDDGRIACVVVEGGRVWVGSIAPAGDRIEPLGLERAPGYPVLASDGRRIAFAGAAPTLGQAIVIADPARGMESVVAAPGGGALDPGLISVAREISFPAEDGSSAHALFYAPVNPAVAPVPGERPPLIVLSHGGPTGNSTDEFDLEIQFWTSRGIAVCDVNYGGSTGYGRRYRKRLEDAWGIVDVADCAAAVRHLVEVGAVDPERVAISGGSAGGYTTLRALTTRDEFSAGASHYGVADLGALARDTHKFESRYLDGLVGPYPERSDVYDERSPINHVDGLSCPVILLQGLEDEVVPPAQAEQMVAALERKGIAHAYLAFEGEQHGFRRAETIRRAAEAELAFYGLIFGFEPADELPPLELRGSRD
ncbi:S9 family peptidase [Thermoleophilia bacterium SCSIO 60948]|nr:S9 family peptidase [Thermoleophilia bacterium SCSIO 60948]